MYILPTLRHSALAGSGVAADLYRMEHNKVLYQGLCFGVSSEALYLIVITLLISSTISVSGESFVPMLLLLSVALVRRSKPPSREPRRERGGVLLLLGAFSFMSL